jgi:hypothetical protein
MLCGDDYIFGKAMREEKRLHPRAEIKWPIVLMTTAGHIFGQTLDLSVGGALIRSWEKPDLISSFSLIFKPPTRRSFMTVTARKVWETTFRLDSNTIVHVLGLRFTEIIDNDLQFLDAVISNCLSAA